MDSAGPFCVWRTWLRVSAAEAQVLDVVHGLVEELGDVVVVQAVDDPAALPRAGDQTQRAQQPQLVRDRRLFHADGFGQLRHAARALAEAGQDHQA